MRLRAISKGNDFYPIAQNRDWLNWGNTEANRGFGYSQRRLVTSGIRPVRIFMESPDCTVPRWGHSTVGLVRFDLSRGNMALWGNARQGHVQ